MLVLKGFIENINSVDNNNFVVSPVMELSQFSKTFSKDIKQYGSSAYPDYTLHSFYAYDDVVGDQVTVPPQLTLAAFEIVALFINYASANTAPYDLAAFNAYISANLPADVNSVSVLNFTPKDGKDYPSSFRFSTMPNNSTGMPEATCVIWLADDAFKTEYDEYEIVVVPPLDPVDTFTDTFTNVANALDAVTFSQLSERMETAKNGYPNTHTRVLEFLYHDPFNPANTKMSQWGILIYGPAGNTIDLIKTEIENYILNNSSSTREFWKKILPDIFARTEFRLYPHWDHLAIDGASNSDDIYRSIQKYTLITDYLVNKLGYADTDVATKGEVFPFDYKALMISSMPSDTNLTDRDELTEIFPDYIPVSSTSVDFARMAPKTRDWIIQLEKAIIEADVDSDRPISTNGYRKLTLGPSTYVTFYYENVSYMVEYRWSYMNNVNSSIEVSDQVDA